MTPSVQLVMPKPKSRQASGKTREELYLEVISIFKEKMPNVAQEIMESWGAQPVFIDLSLLYTVALKVESFQEILRQGNDLGMSLIPSLNLSDDAAIKEVVCPLAKDHESGLRVRLGCSDLDNLAKLSEGIHEFLAAYDLSPETVDLLVDIQAIDDPDMFCKYIALSQKIPNLLKWRTFTFASGFFPKDLSKCKIDEVNLIPRLDWTNWRKQITEKKLQRNPAFSDYVIQHPVYDESFQFFAPSTSIRYTLENEWWILKGRKLRFDLYLANAKLLSEDNRFFGADFSEGDRYISEKAMHFERYIKDPKLKGTGTAETWIQAGTNHHLICTTNQISNLP